MTAAAITAPPMRRLTSVELRKMTDTRAGFWLLLLVVLSALAVVTLVLAVGEAGRPDVRLDVRRLRRDRLGAAADRRPAAS